MGMTSHKFGIDGLDDIVDGKEVISAVDFGYQYDEIEKISKFFTDVLMIVIVDCGDELGEFRVEILPQGCIRLAFVPGATLFAEQFPDGRQEFGKVA